MRPIAEVPLHLVLGEDDKARLLVWLGQVCSDPSTLLSIDTETEGLQPFGPQRHKVRLFQVGDVDEGWAIPFVGNERLCEWIVSMLAQHGAIHGHNSPFDEFMLAEEGLYPHHEAWVDTYIWHHLLYPKDYHGLKPAAGQLIGKACRSGEKWLELVFRKERVSWATVPIEHPAYWGYGALDPVLTSRIAYVMRQEKGALMEEMRPQYERERRISLLTSRMSQTGLRVDVPYAERLVEKWDAEIVELAARLERHQVQSPHAAKQIAAALMNEGWEPDLLTETGQVCTNKDVLSGLDHEIARDVLRWRRIGKWRTTYALPMAESGGRIHPNISSLRATTGRMAVSGPPLQQLPKGPEVRAGILAEEGECMWACDYDGQEMRELAAYASDPKLTEDVLHGGDVHGNIAAVLHGADYSKEQRSWTKNGVYAWAYGAGAGRLSSTAHAEMGAMEAAMGTAYPGVAKFADKVDAIAKRRLDEDGMAWAKTIGGRLVAAPKSRLYALRNYLLQGGGADIAKMALDRCLDAGIDERYLKLIIHDEFLLSSPPGSDVPRQVSELMCYEFRGVPFTTHLSEAGQNWGDVA